MLRGIEAKMESIISVAEASPTIRDSAGTVVTVYGRLRCLLFRTAKEGRSEKTHIWN